MQNKIPSKLYKYQPYKDWSLKNLEDHCLRFSKPIRFNDPFDCAIKLSVDNITDIQWNKLFQIYKEELKSHFTVEEIEDKFLTNGKPNAEFKERTISVVTNLFDEQEKTMLNNRGLLVYQRNLIIY